MHKLLFLLLFGGFFFLHKGDHNHFEINEKNIPQDNGNLPKPVKSSNGVTCYVNSAVVEPNGTLSYDNISVDPGQV